MNRPDEDLELRKQLLAARSSLCRLKIRREAFALRESLSWHRAAVSVASTPAAQNAAFLLALGGLGEERTARLLAMASRILMVARITGVVLSLLRRAPAGGSDR
jgi:hypothetical protein